MGELGIKTDIKFDNFSVVRIKPFSKNKGPHLCIFWGKTSTERVVFPSFPHFSTELGGLSTVWGFLKSFLALI